MGGRFGQRAFWKPMTCIVSLHQKKGPEDRKQGTNSGVQQRHKANDFGKEGSVSSVALHPTAVWTAFSPFVYHHIFEKRGNFCLVAIILPPSGLIYFVAKIIPLGGWVGISGGVLHSWGEVVFWGEV